MMRRVVLFFLLLGACRWQSESAQAESDLNFIMAHDASGQEICDAKRRIATAYRKEQNAEKYELARIEADLSCNRLAVDRL